VDESRCQTAWSLCNYYQTGQRRNHLIIASFKSLNIMKHFFKVAWLLLVPILAFGQSSDYAMFENFYFTPMNGHAADLQKALSAHNQKYHPAGDYAAQVYSVLNGPNAGKLIWSMGPTTWTKIESRPTEEGHDSDWDENVSIHIESYDATEFYKMDEDLSRITGPFDLNVLRIWTVDIGDGHKHHFDVLMKRIKEVNDASDSEVPFGVYRRQLSGSHGMDVVLVWFVESLAYFDQDSDFAERYEAVHGEGAMDILIDDWNAITDRVDMEIWRFMPDMSGHDGKGVERPTND
jgi:hypothetical protein